MDKSKIPYRLQAVHITAIERVLNKHEDTVLLKPCGNGNLKIIRDRKELVKIEPEEDGS